MIPILTYHRISGEKCSDLYTIDEKEFIKDVQSIQERGLVPITVDEYMRDFNESDLGFCSDEKRVIISFDDGHDSDSRIAFPVLESFGFKGTFFVTSEWIGCPGYLSEMEVQKLAEHGMSVQSHGKTHSFLNELSRKEIFSELADSKNRLQTLTGSRVNFVSLPGGRWNYHVIECANDLETIAVFSSDPFRFVDFGSTKLVGRCMVKRTPNGTNLSSIIEMNSFNRLKLVMANYLKSAAKKTLGNRLYYMVWKKLVKKL